MPYDFPRQPEGGGRDLYELYQDLWHLVEQLNIKEQELEQRDGKPVPYEAGR